MLGLIISHVYAYGASNRSPRVLMGGSKVRFATQKSRLWWCSLTGCIWLIVSTLGLYQCVLTPDWDLSALLYLIHDQALLLSFTTHILLFHSSTMLIFAKKKKKTPKQNWLFTVHGLKYLKHDGTGFALGRLLIETFTFNSRKNDFQRMEFVSGWSLPTQKHMRLIYRPKHTDSSGVTLHV